MALNVVICDSQWSVHCLVRSMLRSPLSQPLFKQKLNVYSSHFRLAVRLDFSNVRNDTTLFAELPRVEQNGSGTSPSSNVLPLGQLLCLPGMHCFRRSINCSPKRRKKKTVPLCTHRWTQHGMMANSCIILFSTYGDSAFLGTRRPLRAKALTNFRCVFICFFGRCAAESDRQTWISLAERPRPC